MTNPSPEEVSDFIKQCQSDTPATGDAKHYKKVIEWLLFGKKRPNINNRWYEITCKSCGYSESGYSRGSPSGCPNCYSTNIKTKRYDYNPKFMEEEP